MRGSKPKARKQPPIVPGKNYSREYDENFNIREEALAMGKLPPEKVAEFFAQSNF
jgi:hypothetical protein